MDSYIYTHIHFPQGWKQSNPTLSLSGGSFMKSSVVATGLKCGLLLLSHYMFMLSNSQLFVNSM